MLLAVILPATARAATLDSALALVFEKLHDNLAARGTIVARLSENDEVAIEFDDDRVPAFGAELLVFAQARPETRAGGSEENRGISADSPATAPLLYHGSVTVKETAGHLNLAVIDEGRELVGEGDLVFLPLPVQLYISPVRNLTPYYYFTAQATQSIGRLLASFKTWQVFTLPGSNQKTVAYLKQQCRSQGRYGLILQPFIVNLNGNFQVQLRMTSLFSGITLGAMTEEFKPFVNMAPAAPLRPLNPQPYPGTPRPVVPTAPAAPAPPSGWRPYTPYNR